MSTAGRSRQPKQGDLWGFDRSGGAYRKLQRQFKAHCAARNAPCWLCGGELGPIDYLIRGGTGKAFELDHAQPVSVRPDLALEWQNCRPSHCACNRSRQAKKVRQQLNTTGPAPAHPVRWVKPTW